MKIFLKKSGLLILGKYKMDKEWKNSYVLRFTLFGYTNFYPLLVLTLLLSSICPLITVRTRLTNFLCNQTFPAPSWVKLSSRGWPTSASPQPPPSLDVIPSLSLWRAATMQTHHSVSTAFRSNTPNSLLL